MEIVLVGDTFDDAFQEAMVYSTETGKAFIHPFNDIKIIEGQGTVALEILNQYPHHIDYLIAPKVSPTRTISTQSFPNFLTLVTFCCGVTEGMYIFPLTPSFWQAKAKPWA